MKQSRKKGKNAIPKTTNTEGNEVSTLVPDSITAESSPPTVASGGKTKVSRSPVPRIPAIPSDTQNVLRSGDQALDFQFTAGLGSPTDEAPFEGKHPAHLLDETVDSPISLFTSATAERGGFSTKTPPTSPPPTPRKVRPYSRGAPTTTNLPSRPVAEVQARTSPQQFDLSCPPPPPPPHLPQAHFYGAPEVDLGLVSRDRPIASEESFQCTVLAELPPQSWSPKSRNARILLLGSADRLEVVELAKNNLVALGSIGKIGGNVLDARILTWEFGDDPFVKQRPLVAIVVHGPRRHDQEQPNPSSDASARSSSAIEYQMTVEVYSLATQRHITRLLWTQPTTTFPNFRRRFASTPATVGRLRLDACGNILAISSGTSGEIFVFKAEVHKGPRFRCIGKLWTSVQALNDRRYSNSSNSTDQETSPADADTGSGFQAQPILSLSSRWLAVASPAPGSLSSLGASIYQDDTPSMAPGLESRHPPSRPAPTCDVDSPDAESLINRVARGVAQEVVRGARWLGGEGLQMWNSYWNKDQQGNAHGALTNRQSSSHDGALPTALFPPTHAYEGKTTSTEPQTVSIIDIQALEKNAFVGRTDVPTPIATFEPPQGTSFLSFSPDGLLLISATRKGDVQYVWDLKQIRHLRAMTLLSATESETGTKSGKVIQVARFARLTPTNIVDVEWSRPYGDRFAVVTKNGTIHVFDLPLAAFQWPPIRRPARIEPSSAPPSPAVAVQADESHSSSGGVLSSAIKLAGKTQPMLASLRGRAPSTGVSSAVGNGNSGIALASATGIRGGKAVAAGLSKSVGAATGTINSLRHAGDHRLHLSSLATNSGRSRVCWEHSRQMSTLLVVDGDSVKSFRVSKRPSTSKPRRRFVSIVDTNPTLNVLLPVSCQLAAMSDKQSSQVRDPPDGEDDIGRTTGFWYRRPGGRDARPLRSIHPLSHAEIETNAPYQPFYSDRRVTLSVYDTHSLSDMASSSEPWLFGNDIATRRLTIRPTPTSDNDDYALGIDSGEKVDRHGMEAGSVLYRHASVTNYDGDPISTSRSGDAGGLGPSPSMMSPEAAIGAGPDQQIVVTTRRRKKRPVARHEGNRVGDSDEDENDHSRANNEMRRGRRPGQGNDDDGFFEDDCDVLDFAEDRV